MKWSLPLALSLFLAACGSDAGTPADANGDGEIGCANDPRAQTYSAGMQQMGVGGLLKFVLVSSTPAPPIKGNNTWVVKLLDGSGNAVTGGTLKVTPYMPDHGHGTQVVPQITPQADSYSIDPLYLFMSGLWQVTIQATTTAGNDSGIFNFCIAG
jgi:hypothetical protein